MTVMTIRIPDELKEALDKAFEGRDKHTIIGQIIRDGLAARGIVPEMLPAHGEELAERRRKAVDAILEHRKTMPVLSQEEFRSIREEMRK
jgi:predicted transcriptional regulator